MLPLLDFLFLTNIWRDGVLKALKAESMLWEPNGGVPGCPPSLSSIGILFVFKVIQCLNNYRYPYNKFNWWPCLLQTFWLAEWVGWFRHVSTHSTVTISGPDCIYNIYRPCGCALNTDERLTIICMMILGASSLRGQATWHTHRLYGVFPMTLTKNTYAAKAHKWNKRTSPKHVLNKT